MTEGITFNHFKSGILNGFRKDTGKEAALHYFTYKDKNYELSLITFICLNQKQKHIFVTASPDKIEDALKSVINMNSHLQFNTNNTFIPPKNCDFPYDTLTARLELVV
ncbi:MAG: hypothetical protein ABI760_21925 [Ferruginibacter sp.]